MNAAQRILGVDAWTDPFWLLLLLPLAALGLGTLLREAPAIPWPALPEARAAGAAAHDRLRGASLVVRLIALGLLVAALAGPLSLVRSPRQGAGMDLLLVVDASGSMQALDAEVGGEWRRRIDLAREVVSRFALQRVAVGDRVGLVVFGETAFTQCPLTRDGRLLASALERVEVGVAGESTALGDALALAVKRLGPSAQETGTQSHAGRLIVLLTDGRSNTGSVPVDVAAGIARARGIRVHTVGIGSEGEEVLVALPEHAARRGLRFQRHDLDAATLTRIADETGGRFYAVRSSRDLEAVYAEIDALERVLRELPEEREPKPRSEPLLALAGGLLLAELMVARAWRRRLP